MKTCFRCNISQPLDNFYKHPKMSDGHLGKCKECAKKDVAENYRARYEQYHSYDRVRAQRPERKIAALEYQRRRRQNHPERDSARDTVGRAIKNGKLKRQRCNVCGTSRKVEAHHPDYTKPLDVVWLCFTHHRAAHNQMTVEARMLHEQQEF